MGIFNRLISVALLISIAVQAMLWSTGCVRAQTTDGFISLACGATLSSNETYSDDNGIDWMGDAGIMQEGEARLVGQHTYYKVLNGMRVFAGNASKYCYSLTNSVVQSKEFFLIRASFWPGTTQPYVPKSADGIYRVKLLIDADEWTDVELPYFGNDTWWVREMYFRAQRSNIVVCLARSSPDGDAPFISTLELRPLPSTLSTTSYMNATGFDALYLLRRKYYTAGTDYTVTRYSLDSFDRMWNSVPVAAADSITTNRSIHTTTSVDRPPAKILQSAYLSTSDFRIPLHGTLAGRSYMVMLYFAEIDPAVTAAGQRTFNIHVNYELYTRAGPLDVFERSGGAYEATSYGVLATGSQEGDVLLRFTVANSSSPFGPFIAAFEFFLVSNASATSLSFPADVSAIDDIKTSMNLARYTGDPCLPRDYRYPWAECLLTATPTRVTTISLSNYGTGGVIPKSINNLTLLSTLSLEGNKLEGDIPDLSSLERLEILDLSNNSLSGPIPESLTTLENLKELYVHNNNLSGKIPSILLDRKKASTLKFEFYGNNVLCKVNKEVSCNSSSNNSTLPIIVSNPKKKRNIALIIGIIIPGAFVFGIIIGIFFLFHFKKKKTPFTTNENQPNPRQLKLSSKQTLEPDFDNFKAKLAIKELKFHELIASTNNFETHLGTGGFGQVFRGAVDGRIVAMKVASKSNHQGLKEFLNEVDLLSKVHHRNLVELVGYCTDQNLVLVYEYMQNGSLYDSLHRNVNFPPLSWDIRLKILLHASQGLDYLHNGCNPPIIHRDVKSSNILLADDFEAKISDFGISRNDNSKIADNSCTTLMGTMGYMDPEYMKTLKLTEKIDVYSFGVLIFDVLSGKKAMFVDSVGKQIYLVDWVKPLIDHGSLGDIMDARMGETYNASSAWQVIEVAMACVQDTGEKRPSMTAVYLELKEAQRIEAENSPSRLYDMPSLQLAGGDSYGTISFTQVHTR